MKIAWSILKCNAMHRLDPAEKHRIKHTKEEPRKFDLSKT